jgi:LysR family transcriptional regulator, cyn operon transcriptional activator
MELRHLRYFVTVAEAGGFSKAAARLRITQPALWRQIRDLQAELGLRLFERVGRRVRLTGDGHDLLTRGRDLLTSVESLHERARALRGGHTGTLLVGATPMTIESVFAVFSTRWSRHHPGIELRLTEDSGARLLDQLERGELQFAVTVWGDRRFRSRPLFPAGILAVIPATHRLRTRKTVEVTDLAEHALLLLRNDFISRRWFDAACEVAHVRPRVLFESGAPHTLTALARAGQGIAVVPTHVRIARTRVRVAPVLTGGRPLGTWMGVNWDPRRFLPPYADSFIEELVTSTAQSYPGREFRLALPRPSAGESLANGAPFTR